MNKRTAYQLVFDGFWGSLGAELLCEELSA
jgi:hypothetical protein